MTLTIGAFVAAPIGGLLWAAGAFTFRVGFQWVQAKRKGERFDAFDRPPPQSPGFYAGREGWPEEEERDGHEATISVEPQKGRFF